MKPIILYADDQHDMHPIINFSLANLNCEVVHAEDGKEAWEKIQEIKPVLVLIDYQMPEMSGEEVCAKMKADNQLKSIPVILLTASLESLSEDFLDKSHADDHLFKPFDALELEEKVKHWLSTSLA